MPVPDGIAATPQTRRRGQCSSVLMLTTFGLDEYVFEAVRAGATAFLLREDSTAEELIAAVPNHRAGEALVDRAVTRRVVDAFTRT